MGSITSGNRSCIEHLILDTIKLNRTEHPEVALRDPAYPLKPLQDDISVTLEPMIIAIALPRLEIRAGEFNRLQRQWRQRHWCT